MTAVGTASVGEESQRNQKQIKPETRLKKRVPVQTKLVNRFQVGFEAIWVATDVAHPWVLPAATWIRPVAVARRRPKPTKPPVRGTAAVSCRERQPSKPPVPPGGSIVAALLRWDIDRTQECEAADDGPTQQPWTGGTIGAAPSADADPEQVHVGIFAEARTTYGWILHLGLSTLQKDVREEVDDALVR